MSMEPGSDQAGEPISRKQIEQILQRHALIDQQRLARIQQGLSHEQNRLFGVVALLLHTNHRALPGYFGEDAPAGICGYIPARDTILLAKHFARDFKDKFLPQPMMPIEALYLIGSSGTLGQDRQSDFDFWVCHHADLDELQLSLLQSKLDLIEQAAKKLGMQWHFFLLHAKDFRSGKHAAISEDSSGDTQHHLLLEEFYRSGLLLAGTPPLWWLAPTSPKLDYPAWSERMLSQRFVRPTDWLDFGGLGGIGPDEFFSAAHWQLYKGIALPYKSMLKLMLFEAYATEYPAIRWVSDDIRQLVHGQDPISADITDPYLLMMQRVERHLNRRNEPKRLALARRAFYIKSGVMLSQYKRQTWKYVQMRQLVEEWGWSETELIAIDSYRTWKLDRVIDERNLLLSELSRSYRLLTDFSRQHMKQQPVRNSDLSLLGRKLQVSLERRPGKIDCVNPGISKDLSADRLWLRPNQTQHTWELYLQPPEQGAKAIRITRGPVDMLTWLASNQVIDKHTRIDLPKIDGAATDEHLKILTKLHTVIAVCRENPIPLRNFARAPQAKLSIIFINVMCHQHDFVDAADDPLNSGSEQHNRIRMIEHLQCNSWGQLQVDAYDGAEAPAAALCAHLGLLSNNVNQFGLESICHAPTTGIAINSRINALVKLASEHFQQHGEQARLLFLLNGQFIVIERKRSRHEYQLIGNQRQLLEYLAGASEQFRPTCIDPVSMPDSPLPLIFECSQAGQVSVFYWVQRGGISLSVIDHTGVMHQQWLPDAEEPHLLIQLGRFFETLRTWHQVLPDNNEQGKPAIRYFQLSRQSKQWQAEPINPPKIDNSFTELVLSTGRRGPWKDGFSLISDSQEFNSLQLGDALYDTVVDYVLQMRHGNAGYPLYLTGATIADSQVGSPFSLAELLGFKRLVEKRLADAVARRYRKQGC